MKLKYVALIPAKGLSFGVPRKNLQLVGNRTLLARTIDVAREVRRFGSIVVSTEDSEIAEIATGLGAEVHIRSGVSAQADASAAEVVLDFTQSFLQHDSGELQVLVYLQPTSPFRSRFHIESALDLFERGGGVSVVSVGQVKQFPEKMVVRDGDIICSDRPEFAGQGINRQDLPSRFYPNGAIYIFSVAEFRAKSAVPIDQALFFEMDEISSLDVDSPEDLKIARALEAYAGT